MNKLKSMFIGVYPMLAMAAIVWVVMKLISAPTDPLWWGILLINVPVVALIAKAMMFQNTARTDPYLKGILTVTTIGFLMAEGSLLLYSLAAYGSEVVTIQAVTAISYASVLLYVFWYSKLGRPQNSIIQVGKPLPDVRFEDSDGNEVTSASLKGRPVIYLFYRGNWCPLCMAQIKEIAAEYKRLEATGTQVVLVSPQSHEKTAALANRFDVKFKFLTDPALASGKALGIFMKNGLPMGMEMLGYDSDTLYPTIVVTDKEGVVIFHDQTDNYRVRPEPETFLKVVEGIA